jgi:acetylornithine deacetylase
MRSILAIIPWVILNGDPFGSLFCTSLKLQVFSYAFIKTLTHRRNIMSTLQTEKTILADLIRHDTTSDRSNLEIIDYIANLLDGTGASITIDLNEAGTKENLLATIGPQDQAGGIVLSGHTDTVPVAGQNWSTDPYKLVEKDNKLFARGAVDMKGFDALALSCFIEVAKRQSDLKRPLSVLLTYDEEIGCFGAQNFVRDKNALLGKPELILVGEPTELKPVIAHKGIHCFDITITGKSCHSSNPENGVSAIKYGARATALLYEIAREFEQAGLRDERFTPAHSTLNVGTLQGGSAVNIVADQCRITFETRPIPGETRDDLLRRVQEFFEEASFQKGKAFSYEIKEYVSNAPFVGNAQATGTRFLIDQLDHKKPLAVPFMTEASAFQNGGFNTVVCGPGSIDQAHQPDEFITLDQFAKGAALLNRVTQRCFQSI